MSSRILTIIICGISPIILVVGMAIIGTLNRIRLANRIFTGISKGKFRDLSESQNKKKIRLHLILAMLSIFGVLAITIIAISGILTHLSGFVVAAYIGLAFIGILSSATLYNEVIKRIK
ncbi:MAG: hypothetical protein JXB38_22445 [Anaerolineales bacterium]|nr:hypothetical protein [Anaerolineales bacterium]